MNTHHRIAALLVLWLFVAGQALAGNNNVVVEASNTGGTLTLNIGVAPGVEWTALEESDWFQITSATSGTGPITMTISYQANPASTTRVGILTIRTSADSIIEIHQLPTGPWTLAVGGGQALTPPTREGKYENNAVVEIAATIPPGKEFVRWIGATSTVADIADPTTTVTMLSNVSISAEFDYAVPELNNLTPSTGPDTGGTQVSLQGKNLTEASLVLFGGVPATNLQLAADNLVICRAPAHAAGNVQVTIETPGGTSNALTYIYTATTPAAPVLTQISPASGPAEGGTQVTIVGSNLNGATLVSFGGTPATGINVGGANLVTCITPARSGGNVQVTVTTPGGTSNGLPFSFEGGDSGGCGGGKSLPSFEEALADLLMGLLVAGVLLGSAMVWRQG